MKIWFDDIVYSLQKAGGISVLWSKVTNELPFETCHIRYKDAEENNSFAIRCKNHKYDILDKNFFFLRRYLNPKLSKETEPFLFHSSYYRYCTNPLAVNVTTLHDFIYELYGTGLSKVVHGMQKKNAVLHSDAVICISQNTKKDLEKFYPNYNGKVKVIYNGYDTDTYFYIPSKKERIILSVGSRTCHKRFDLTVRLLKELTDCKLIIIGGGNLTPDEIKLLEDNASERYEKVGYLSNKELRTIYNKAFFLSYCSDYEGFGIPPIEAQACGCPVVCQAKSSLPEVVRDSAIYIDSSNMKKAIDNVRQLYSENFYKEILQKGLDNVKRFSWDKCRTEVIDFYNEILESKGLKL